jgi:dCMP deaminase
MYVALFPCNECAKAIVQSGIVEVVYLEDKYADTDAVRASKKIFLHGGVKLRQLVPEHDSISIDFHAD